MTWKIPPRRFPHGSYSQVPAVPELGEEGIFVDKELDPNSKRLMEHFEKSLAAGLDWMQEQLGGVFLGVPLVNQRGQATAAEGSAVATFTFPTEEADTNYSAFVSPASQTGTPAAGSFTVVGVLKTVTGVSVSLQAAPGAGNTVTYDVIVVREITR